MTNEWSGNIIMNMERVPLKTGANGRLIMKNAYKQKNYLCGNGSTKKSINIQIEKIGKEERLNMKKVNSAKYTCLEIFARQTADGGRVLEKFL